MKGKTTHQKWNKMMGKEFKDRTNKKKKISVNIKGEMTLDEFAEKISQAVYQDADFDIDVAFFIALLESKFENWDITIDLMNHFDSLKKVFKEEVAPDDWKEYTPKLDSPKDLLNRKLK